MNINFPAATSDRSIYDPRSENFVEPWADPGNGKLWEWNEDKLRWETARASVAAITSAIIPTVTVGGISVNEAQVARKPVEDILREMLSPYTAGSFTSFSVLGIIAGSVTPAAPGTREVGALFTPTSASIGWVNDSEQNAPYAVTLTGPQFATSQSLTGGSPKAVTAQGGSFTSNVAANTTWTLAGKDKNGANIASRTVTLSWQHMWAFGASAALVADVSSAQSVYDALQQKALRPGRAHTVTTTAVNSAAENKYTYIAFAAVYNTGTVSIIQDGAQPVLGAFAPAVDFTITTATGLSVLYRFYRSNSPGAFATGTVLAIS